MAAYVRARGLANVAREKCGPELEFGSFGKGGSGRTQDCGEEKRRASLLLDVLGGNEAE